MFLLGVDIGSSSEKVAVFDYNGNLVASSKTDYPIYEDIDGYVEQNADDYYLAFLQNLERYRASSNAVFPPPTTAVS